MALRMVYPSSPMSFTALLRPSFVSLSGAGAQSGDNEVKTTTSKNYHSSQARHKNPPGYSNENKQFSPKLDRNRPAATTVRTLDTKTHTDQVQTRKAQVVRVTPATPQRETHPSTDAAHFLAFSMPDDPVDMANQNPQQNVKMVTTTMMRDVFVFVVLTLACVFAAEAPLFHVNIEARNGSLVLLAVHAVRVGCCRGCSSWLTSRSLLFHAG